jgi:hypothetical protein
MPVLAPPVVIFFVINEDKLRLADRETELETDATSRNMTGSL